MAEAIHLRPTAELADRVLLPGDPGRALLLAQSLLAEPRMFHHNRGLWGYSGTALADGRPLTIQATGMGGPSAAIVAAELVSLGARRLLRVGTCGALTDEAGLGELLVVAEALARDGTSRALGAGDRVRPDRALLEGLELASRRIPARPAVVVTTDLFYEVRPAVEAEWAAVGAAAVEMEAAALFALARTRGVQAGAVLIVSDVLHPERRRIEPEALVAAEQRLGELAVAALLAG